MQWWKPHIWPQGVCFQDCGTSPGASKYSTYHFSILTSLKPQWYVQRGSVLLGLLPNISQSDTTCWRESKRRYIAHHQGQSFFVEERLQEELQEEFMYWTLHAEQTHIWGLLLHGKRELQRVLDSLELHIKCHLSMRRVPSVWCELFAHIAWGKPGFNRSMALAEWRVPSFPDCFMINNTRVFLLPASVLSLFSLITYQSTSISKWGCWLRERFHRLSRLSVIKWYSWNSSASKVSDFFLSKSTL